jgi:hypothetical protein
MIAKTGAIMIWHWAHEQENSDCPYAGEGAWHLSWKARGLPGTQEIRSPDFLRRADVLSPAGFAIEFQHSSLTWDEVRARELDWQYRLCWVFDARRKYRAGLIEQYHDEEGDWLVWPNLPAMVRAARCRAFLDLGRGSLWYVDYYIRDDGESGLDYVHGFLTTEDAVVRNVLHAKNTIATAAMSLRMDLWQ